MTRVRPVRADEPRGAAATNDEALLHAGPRCVHFPRAGSERGGGDAVTAGRIHTKTVSATFRNMVSLPGRDAFAQNREYSGHLCANKLAFFPLGNLRCEPDVQNPGRARYMYLGRFRTRGAKTKKARGCRKGAGLDEVLTRTRDACFMCEIREIRPSLRHCTCVLVRYCHLLFSTVYPGKIRTHNDLS